MRNIRTWWPFRHLGLKVLSVALAVLLWMVVAGEETVERGLLIPLELQQFPVGLELEGSPPSLVDARVRGSSGTLSRLSSGDVVAVIDLRGARVGRRLFPLTPDQVRAPFGVAPPVYLSRRGAPATFAANNGRGGAFIISGGTLAAGGSAPPGSSSSTTTPSTPSRARRCQCARDCGLH